MRDEATTDHSLKALRSPKPEGEPRRILSLASGVILTIMGVLASWYFIHVHNSWSMGGMMAGLAMVAASAVAALSLRPAKGGNARLLSPIFSTLDTTLNGRALTDNHGRLIYANTSYRRMVGAGLGRAPSPVDLPFQTDVMRERVRALMQMAAEGGLGHEIVALDVSAPSARRWLRLSASSGGGDGQAVAWQITDASNPLQEQDAMLQALKLLGPALEEARLGMAVLDRDQVLTSSPGLAQALEGDPAAAQAFMKDMRSLQPQNDFRLPHGDNGRMLSRSPLPLMGKDASLVLFSRLDPQPAAVLEEERFHRYFAQAPLAIAILDKEGRLHDHNELFRQLLPPNENDQRLTLSDIFPDSDAAEVADRIRTATLRHTAPPVDVRLRHLPDRQGQLFIQALGDEEERLIAYMVDVTEQKNLELQFAQSQKMQAVGQLAGGIAHDFNNLLTAITGFCDLLLVRHGPGDQSFADIMQIKQNANRAANLVRQLLAFSRQQTLRPKVLNVTDVLAELSNLLRRLIGANIDLKMVHGRSLGPVRVDQGQLEQVIINLAVNARDAMPDGGTLTIRTTDISLEQSRTLGHSFMPPGEYVLIEVADTGVGIPKEHLGKIFEPFFSTKEVGKGTGLGLSTVYGIVKQTGGFIFPISEPGKGATFRIYLPVHTETEEAPPPPNDGAVQASPAKDLTGKASILLVEDEDAVRMFAARALKNKGYRVWEAASGEAAMAVVDEHGADIDLLISDVVMPNMDGPTLVKAIRGRNNHMKIIFISGYAEDAFKKNLDKGEQFSFLPKPFSLKQLAEKVKEVLES
jgi:signal transduction histidine kinase